MIYKEGGSTAHTKKERKRKEKKRKEREI